MKKLSWGNFAKQAALYALKRDANCTTCLVVYQPKIPANLNQFKRVKLVYKSSQNGS